MTAQQNYLRRERPPLRLWPGVVTVVVQWLLWSVLPRVAPSIAVVGMLGGVAAGLIVLIWWLFFSRAPWSERIGALVLMIAAVIVTKRFVDPSIAGGAMGMLLALFVIPALSLALVAWAVVSQSWPAGSRRLLLVFAILLACGSMTLMRTGGMSGDGQADLHWRWTPTPEERLLAASANDKELVAPAPTATSSPKAGDAPIEPASAIAKAADKAVTDPPADVRPAEWPGFRGPARDGVAHAAQIQTDWSEAKPVELWRRAIGPAWSSFAVQGDLIYTQEQRGPDEMVSCYNLMTGAPVWKHRDAARFYESNGGPGPRGTPTLSRGRVYTFGATGIVNSLDARTGSVFWTHNAAADTGAKLPAWGFSSSPLVLGDSVYVAASGTLASYDVSTGNLRWVGPKGAGSYSSPQAMTFGGVTQIVLLNTVGATGFAPADGKVLWKHEWPGGSIVQPAQTPDGDVLINSLGMNGGTGLRRLAITHASSEWAAQEKWTTTGLKPYFNDFVINKGYAFGFDGNILACIDLADGQRKWKGGRYGNGQIILLPDQDLLLVLAEEGELALVKATPDQFTEVTKMPAIEGKTWNHPVLVGDILLVRNGEEMAAFRLR